MLKVDHREKESLIIDEATGRIVAVCTVAAEARILAEAANLVAGARILLLKAAAEEEK